MIDSSKFKILKFPTKLKISEKMEKRFIELLTQLSKSKSAETSDQLCKDILNNLQSKEAQNHLTNALRTLDIEYQISDIFFENRFSALLLFQAFSNSVIKNTSNVEYFLKKFTHIEAGEDPTTITDNILSQVLNFGL